MEGLSETHVREANHAKMWRKGNLAKRDYTRRKDPMTKTNLPHFRNLRMAGAVGAE